MSHPISGNMEYLQQIRNPLEKRPSTFSDDDLDNEQQSPVDVASKLHSIFRKMSINIQRDEGTPEKHIVTGNATNPSAHERALMLSIPHSSDTSEIGDETFEDANLPTVEEVAVDCEKLNEPCTNYFENPFDSSGDDETTTLYNHEDHKVHHPLDSHETKAFSSSPAEIMQSDEPQGK